MKHADHSEAVRESIRQGACAMGILLEEDGVSRLACHLEAVLRANEQFNLTAVRDAMTAVTVHVLDSLAAVPWVLGEAGGGAIVDIGSGAGYPGVPLGIATGRRVVLLESVGKRAEFLGSVVDQLGLDADVVCERAEVFALDRPGAHALAVARAVAALPALMELARPLLGDGGLFVGYKGAPEPEELGRASAAAAVLGFGVPEVRTVVIPGLEGRRSLVLCRVERDAEVRLPRRVGLAQKRPLP